MSWYVYILECANGSLYTGITNNLEKRFNAHKTGKGAWFTRVFGVKEILYTEPWADKSSAFKREREIKRWSRQQKIDLIEKKTRRSL
ncbi:MAG TPA: GIY-YIG nuclease family protein [Candidatus Omnitrophota bacterium]|nr:GIY-YIG nuclease family protein [Candidatus Omnitrophota bacterium]HPN88000.1 GIY-YIG nuclease family protein [Candidatus Omnitrophota bacterium]